MAPGARSPSSVAASCRCAISELPASSAPAAVRTARAPVTPTTTDRGRCGSSLISCDHGASARAPPSPPAASARANPQATDCGAEDDSVADRLASASAPVATA